MSSTFIKSIVFQLIALVNILSLATSCSKSETSPEPSKPIVKQEITINKFSPSKAYANSIVTITGNNFSTVAADNSVKFNGVTAKVNSATVNELIVTVPEGASTGKITVSVQTENATSGSNFTLKTGVMSQYASLGSININQIKFDSDGKLFGETDNTIFRINDNGTAAFRYKVAGNTFVGLAADNQGNLFIGAGYIGKLTPQNIFSVSAGQTPGLGGIKDGTGAEARLNGSGGISNDGNGNFYYPDVSCVRKITATGVVTTIAGNLTGDQGVVDGIGSAAKFGVLTRITSDATGNVYVVDADHFRIRKITQTGEVTTVVGNGTYGLADGNVSSSQIENPQAITSDADGNIFFSDIDFQAKIYRIKMINKLGVVSTFMSGTDATGTVNGDIGTASINKPYGLTFDAAGNLYIVNAGSHVVSKVTFN